MTYPTSRAKHSPSTGEPLCAPRPGLPSLPPHPPTLAPSALPWLPPWDTRRGCGPRLHECPTAPEPLATHRTSSVARSPTPFRSNRTGAMLPSMARQQVTVSLQFTVKLHAKGWFRAAQPTRAARAARPAKGRFRAAQPARAARAARPAEQQPPAATRIWTLIEEAARAALKSTARCFPTTSEASPPRSSASRAVVASSARPASSTRRRAASSKT